MAWRDYADVRALLYIIYNINNLHQSVMTQVGIGRQTAICKFVIKIYNICYIISCYWL